MGRAQLDGPAAATAAKSRPDSEHRAAGENIATAETPVAETGEGNDDPCGDDQQQAPAESFKLSATWSEEEQQPSISQLVVDTGVSIDLALEDPVLLDLPCDSPAAVVPGEPEEAVQADEGISPAVAEPPTGESALSPALSPTMKGTKRESKEASQARVKLQKELEEAKLKAEQEKNDKRSVDILGSYYSALTAELGSSRYLEGKLNSSQKSRFSLSKDFEIKGLDELLGINSDPMVTTDAAEAVNILDWRRFSMSRALQLQNCDKKTLPAITVPKIKLKGFTVQSTNRKRPSGGKFGSNTLLVVPSVEEDKVLERCSYLEAHLKYSTK